jgi:hypothetical protein
MRARAEAAAAEVDDGESAVEIAHLPRVWHPLLPTPRLPIGVGLLAIGVAALGLVFVVAAVFSLANEFLGAWVPLPTPILSLGDPVGEAILILLGGVLIAVATALWRQEFWAFGLTVGLVFLGLIYLLFTASITVLFLLLVVLFIYLVAVRRHFY